MKPFSSLRIQLSASLSSQIFIDSRGLDSNPDLSRVIFQAVLKEARLRFRQLPI